MILSQPLIIGASLPKLVNTFGAASVILSPILNMLLFAAALYVIVHIFHIAQQNNWFRNIFAAIGALSFYNFIVNFLSRSNNEVLAAPGRPEPAMLFVRDERQPIPVPVFPVRPSPVVIYEREPNDRPASHRRLHGHMHGHSTLFSPSPTTHTHHSSPSSQVYMHGHSTLFSPSSLSKHAHHSYSSSDDHVHGH